MNNPANYSKYNPNPLKDSRLFLTKYKDFFKWKKSENILEIGCANGIVTRDVLYPFLEEHVDKILGTDISQEAIDVANRIHATPKISFRRMNIEEENLGLKYKEQFDHIFAFAVLHLIKTPDIWSRNIYEMLKPNGQFFASVAILPHPYVTVSGAQRADKTAPWAKYLEQSPDFFVDYRPDAIEKLSGILKNAGFTIDVIEMNKTTMDFENIQDLNGTMLSINGFLKYIPEELRDSYTKDFLERIVAIADRGEDGSYSYPKNFVVLLATKT